MDLEKVIKEFQKEGCKVILCHNANQDFKEAKVKDFYMKLGLRNLYQEANSLTDEELPGMYIIGLKHIDHIMGTSFIVEALVSVNMLEVDSHIESDHTSFMIKLDAKKLLRTKLSKHVGNRVIVRHVNWEKVLKDIEKKVVDKHLEFKTNQLEKDTKAYDRVDRTLIKIIKKALKKGSRGRNKLDTAYFTEFTVKVERKYTFLNEL